MLNSDVTQPIHREPAVLVLEDGRVARGQSYGALGATFGEAVFNTGMTGYQETLTDPSYHRQVVVMTAPHIGNTGVNDEDGESERIWVAGFVIRDPSRVSSNWRATRGLEDELRDQGIVGICGVDTRALTRHLRECGAMRVGIFAGEQASRPITDLLAQVQSSPSMAGSNLTDAVTTTKAYTVPSTGPREFSVVAIDLGIKTMTPYRLSERGVEVQVVPSLVTASEIMARNPDGVFFSNGPGDPATADTTVNLMTELLTARVPVFGICFGNQILGRALGLETYKLRYGHRGINSPVQDLRTGRVSVTAHNHGFAVEAPRGGPFQTQFGAAEVSHVCLNDDVVEGLRCLEVPAFSVQYHPEAAAGPHDAAGLFDEFVDLMRAGH